MSFSEIDAESIFYIVSQIVWVIEKPYILLDVAASHILECFRYLLNSIFAIKPSFDNPSNQQCDKANKEVGIYMLLGAQVNRSCTKDAFGYHKRLLYPP